MFLFWFHCVEAFPHSEPRFNAISRVNPIEGQIEFLRQDPLLEKFSALWSRDTYFTPEVVARAPSLRGFLRRWIPNR